MGAALCFTGLVTFIAMYHYFRIFNSFEKAYTPCKVTNGIVDYNDCNADTYGYNPTGHAFNDAYRYVDWLLTVPPSSSRSCSSWASTRTRPSTGAAPSAS